MRDVFCKRFIQSLLKESCLNAYLRSIVMKSSDGAGFKNALDEIELDFKVEFTVRLQRDSSWVGERLCLLKDVEDSIEWRKLSPEFTALVVELLREKKFFDVDDSRKNEGLYRFWNFQCDDLLTRASRKQGLFVWMTVMAYWMEADQTNNSLLLRSLTSMNGKLKAADTIARVRELSQYWCNNVLKF